MNGRLRRGCDERWYFIFMKGRQGAGGSGALQRLVASLCGVAAFGVKVRLLEANS